MNHSGERPRRRSDDDTEASLANWLKMALVRRARAYNSRPSARQLTAIETAHLNNILAQAQVLQVAATASASSSGDTAMDLNPVPKGAEPPEPSTSKRLRQKSSASNRFSTAEAVPDVDSKRIRTQTTPHNNNKAVTLSMRGLNIQWPFSQLLLMGAKLEEVRRYPLNHRGIVKTQEEVFIVETKGPVVDKDTNAILTGIQIAARPTKPQIVGTISFASAQRYSNKQAFHEARDRHRIKVGSKFDWDGNSALYGWRVGRVRALAEPIPIGRTGQTGFSPRGFSVVFATTTAQRDPSVNAPAGEDDAEASAQMRPVARPLAVSEAEPTAEASVNTGQELDKSLKARLQKLVDKGDYAGAAAVQKQLDEHRVDEEAYEAEIARLVEDKDFLGAAKLKAEKDMAKSRVEEETYESKLAC